MTTSNLKLKMPAPFPSNVIGVGGIQVQKANGLWTVGPDFSALAQIATLPDPTSKELWVFDPVTNTYSVMTVAQIGLSLFADTSTTSLTIGTGPQTFVVNNGKVWKVGSWIIAASQVNPANFMLGQVTGYATVAGVTSLTLNVVATGGTGTFADWGLTLSGPPATSGSAIEYVIDGLGAQIIPGQYGFIEVPFACTITRVSLASDVAGNCVVDIWKAPAAAFPPAAPNSITAADLPTLAAAQLSQDSALTGWTTQINAGDFLAFAVNSSSTVTRLTISLAVTKH